VVRGTFSPARAWRPAVVARLARTLGSAVATSQLIGAVMKTASLRGPARTEAECMRTPRSGQRDERANLMHRASSASAEREVVAASHAGRVERSGSRSCEGRVSALRAPVGALGQKCRGPTLSVLTRRLVCMPGDKGSRSCNAAGSRLPPSSKALPNPSLKLSPNSKTPGPRYSAVHHLQRGPGVLPSVPA
jgi:hypothetical protein